MQFGVCVGIPQYASRIWYQKISKVCGKNYHNKISRLGFYWDNQSFQSSVKNKIYFFNFVQILVLRWRDHPPPSVFSTFWRSEYNWPMGSKRFCFFSQNCIFLKALSEITFVAVQLEITGNFTEWLIQLNRSIQNLFFLRLRCWFHQGRKWERFENDLWL